MTPAGVDLEQQIEDHLGVIAHALEGQQAKKQLQQMTEATNGATPPQQAKPKVKPRAGSEFFGLADEMEASGRRLDEHARDLKKEMAATEKLAGEVVQEKIVQQQTARDFINRMRKATDDLGDNGGPSLMEDSEDSPPPSNEQKTAE